jgi:hypothetical protein
MLVPFFSPPTVGAPPGKNGSSSRRRPTVGISRRGLGRGVGVHYNAPPADCAVAVRLAVEDRREISPREMSAAADSDGGGLGRGSLTRRMGVSGVGVRTLRRIVNHYRQ